MIKDNKLSITLNDAYIPLINKIGNHLEVENDSNGQKLHRKGKKIGIFVLMITFMLSTEIQEINMK